MFNQDWSGNDTFYLFFFLKLHVYYCYNNCVLYFLVLSLDVTA